MAQSCKILHAAKNPFFVFGHFFSLFGIGLAMIGADERKEDPAVRRQAARRRGTVHGELFSWLRTIACGTAFNSRWRVQFVSQRTLQGVDSSSRRLFFHGQRVHSSVTLEPTLRLLSCYTIGDECRPRLDYTPFTHHWWGRVNVLCVGVFCSVLFVSGSGRPYLLPSRVGRLYCWRSGMYPIDTIQPRFM